jgi:quinol monooxygenase YgiN
MEKKDSLNIWRFHHMLRPSQPFHPSLRFSTIHIIYRYLYIIPVSFPSPGVGKTVAATICMILVIIRMKVLPEKRMELSQAIASLVGPIRTEKGCLRCDFCRSMEDENELHILEEWNTRENLNSHLKSDRFRVLRGAMKLLQEPYEMVSHTVAAGKRKRDVWSQPPVQRPG